jgi:hypothetical protein
MDRSGVGDPAPFSKREKQVIPIDEELNVIHKILELSYIIDGNPRPYDDEDYRVYREIGG